MLYGMTGVKTINIASTVTRIEDYGVYANTGVENVTIPDSVVYIGYKAFDGCSALNTVDIKGSPAIMSRAFRTGENLTTVYIRGAYASIDHAYAPGEESAENYVLCKGQSCNPNVNNGLTIYIANSTLENSLTQEKTAGATVYVL